jgi:hypothetical protein
MTWYPQIGAGSIAQFPITRSRQWRTIANALESGARITLPDQHANQIGWRLDYQDLTDAEVQNLTGLFGACQGRAAAFGFVDPLANLLGWSEDLTRPDWQAGLLTTAPDVNDPLGSQRAWSLTNNAIGTLSLQQTLGISGDYIACFSVWVKGSGRGTVILRHDATQSTVPVGTAWSRVFISGAGLSGAAHSTFAVSLLPGQQVEIFGPQVEAQPYPSGYKRTVTARGIYPQTWFASDDLSIVSTGPGLSSSRLTLQSQL